MPKGFADYETRAYTERDAGERLIREIEPAEMRSWPEVERLLAGDSSPRSPS